MVTMNQTGGTSTSVVRRFVACLDVLGFKALLRRRRLADIYNEYANMRRQAAQSTRVVQVSTTPQGHIGGGIWQASFVVASDTWLLWCDDVPTAVDSFLTALCALVAQSVRLRLPMRGGVAFGETVIDGVGTFIGQPFVDAYLTEQAQEWIGVALHPSCFQGSTSVRTIASHDDVVRCSVPVKKPKGCSWRRLGPSGLLLDHAITWHHYSQASDVERDLEDLERSSPKEAQAKYRNTRSFVRRYELR